MSPIGRWFESGFDVAYLVVVWTLVAKMLRRHNSVASGTRQFALRFAVAFFVLAFGDSFHVGARVLATLGLRTAEVAGVSMSLLGLGMMVTAYTVTGFYMALVDARRVYLGRRDGWFWAMETLLSLRLVLMALPGNDWGAEVPPWGMSLERNAPLVAVGAALAFWFVREGVRRRERGLRDIGAAMLVSYACYLPVILFAASVPALGLLMIPKTIAYVVMGLIAWRAYFSTRAPSDAGRSERPTRSPIAGPAGIREARGSP